MGIVDIDRGSVAAGGRKLHPPAHARELRQRGQDSRGWGDYPSQCRLRKGIKQRNQDKRSFGCPRVWQREYRVVADNVAVVDDVDVESSGTPSNLTGAVKILLSEVRKAVQEGIGLTLDDVVALPPGALPKTSSGKLQRARCREQYLGETLSLL